MDGKKGGAQIGCPDPSRWLAVAAGSEMADQVAMLSEHATTCADCAAQLREAIHLVADEGDVAESQFVAGLKSSQPNWRKRMAQRLATPASGQVDDSRRVGLFSHLWFRPALRTAAAVAAIGLVVSVSWLTLIRRGADSGTKAGQVAQPFTPTPSGNRESEPAQANRQQGPLYMAELTLEPGATRGVGSAPILVLRSETKAASITLLFLEVPPQRLNVALVSSSGQSVWSTNLVLTTPEVNARRATLKIPANLLQPDDYNLVATVHSATGSERIATYACRIIRQ